MRLSNLKVVSVASIGAIIVVYILPFLAGSLLQSDRVSAQAHGVTYNTRIIGSGFQGAAQGLYYSDNCYKQMGKDPNRILGGHGCIIDKPPFDDFKETKGTISPRNHRLIHTWKKGDTVWIRVQFDWVVTSFEGMIRCNKIDCFDFRQNGDKFLSNSHVDVQLGLNRTSGGSLIRLNAAAVSKKYTSILDALGRNSR